MGAGPLSRTQRVPGHCCMTQDSKRTAKLSQAKIHWSVHVIDKAANVGIRVGGLGVIFAVLGLVFFIVSQVVPLFRASDHGEYSPSAAPLAGRPMALHADEYRRIALRLDADGTLHVLAVPTGAAMETLKVPNLGQAQVSAAHISARPFTHYDVGPVQGIPKYALTLGLSDGRVLQGSISYVHAFKRFALNEDPVSWRKLRQPEKEELGKPDYTPEILVEREKDGDAEYAWLVEHLNDFGFYRRVRAVVTFDREIDIGSGGEAISRVYSALHKGAPDYEREALTTAITSKGRVLLRLEKLALNGMTDELEAEELFRADVTAQLAGTPVLCIAHESQAEAWVGNSEGKLFLFKRVDEKGKAPVFVRPAEYPPVDAFSFHVEQERTWAQTVSAMRDDSDLGAPAGDLKLTALEYLLGGTSLLIGDSHGGVQSWFAVRETKEDNNPKLRRIHVHEPGGGEILGFCACEANKSFAVWDKSGFVRGLHNTSERVIFEERVAEPGLPQCYYAAKAGGTLGIDAKGGLRHWWVDAKHSEISFKALFGSVWYEGYAEPKYEWQTSSGTDDVEAKYSLMPLIRGSIKGGMYALLFAIPLAVLGAIYTSEFMHRNVRAVVKPAMEVMASLPSVVLGFLGALYFAPMAAPIMPTLLMAVALCPALFMFFGWIWQQLPPTFTGRFGPKAILAMLFLILACGVLLATLIGPRFEEFLFPALEGADPALIDSKTFLPINEEAARKLSAGDFRSWTAGGAQLARDTSTPQGALPKGWWIPGGHSLFMMILLLPFALLAGWLLKAGGAVLFGGRGFGRDWRGLIASGNPFEKMRQSMAGQSGTTLWPIAVDVSFSLAFALLAGLMGLGLSMLLAPGLESLLFGYDHPTAGHVADFRRFVTGAEGWKFNQTNSLIVGFSMGFAVIPIIYSIAEDALSTVPNQLRAASLACGASRWQTTTTVVVPAAASGIFSAIVIGLGRALGETMIVVMAAGGTPVMEMEPLSGFRSLSAAIAIEMPEAPHGGTLYRTLFLGGLMLFLVTFVISTAAEVVRMRLRKKLSRM
jgi:ABC-type uncharacterized transport system permease subunit